MTRTWYQGSPNLQVVGAQLPFPNTQTACLALVQAALCRSQQDPTAPWLQVAAPLLELHAALAAQCRTPVLGAQMLRLVVSEDVAGLLAPIASLPAAKPDMAAYSATEVAAVTASLHFAAAVAALISRQPDVNQVNPELSMTL